MHICPLNLCIHGLFVHLGIYHRSQGLFANFKIKTSFFILHSSFFILHTSFFKTLCFKVHSSKFILRSSSFTLHSSNFILQTSFFILYSSNFILRSSNSIRYSSYFILQTSFFKLHPSSLTFFSNCILQIEVCKKKPYNISIATFLPSLINPELHEKTICALVLHICTKNFKLIYAISNFADTNFVTTQRRSSDLHLRDVSLSSNKCLKSYFILMYFST